MAWPTFRIFLMTMFLLALVAATTAVVDLPYDRTFIQQANSQRAQVLDEPSRDFALSDLNGNRVTLASLRGRVVFVNFWATWCAPCREEIPAMIELASRMSDRPFTMLAISQDEDLDALRAFVQEFELDASRVVVLSDPDGEVATAWGTVLLPETYLVDPAGQVALRFQNARDWTAPEFAGMMERMMVRRWRQESGLQSLLGEMSRRGGP
jgi:thiol-disulfide isomerase/thioredoxin